MSELVLFAIPTVQGDKNAHIMLAGENLDASAGKLGGNLIKSACANALLGTGNMEGADWWVMGGLLGEIRDANILSFGRRCLLRNSKRNGRSVLLALRRDFETAQTTLPLRLAELRSPDLGRIVLRLPIALVMTVSMTFHSSHWSSGQSHSEKLAKGRVVRFTRLALCIFEVLCQPEAHHFEHSIEGLVGLADASKGVGRIDVGPVFEVRGGLKKLRWQ